MNGSILQNIAEQSPPVRAQGPWGFLKPVNGVRDLPFADAARVDELRAAFTEEELAGARVLICGSDHQLEWNPILAGPSARGLFLRRTKDETPFDVVNQHGSLTSRDPPAFGCAMDFFTQEWMDESKTILVAVSDADLAILRMLSLPCTPAAGLATLDGVQLRRLFPDATDVSGSTSGPTEVVPIVAAGCRLVVTGWNVSALKNELPSEAARIIERLLKAEDTFGFETTPRVGIWQPTAAEFTRICAATEFQDRPIVRQSLRESICHSTRSVREFLKDVVRRQATDYGHARQELLLAIARARRSGFHTADISERLESLNRSFDHGVVEALIHDAMAASDPVDRALLMTAAELMGHWHTSSGLVRSTQAGVIERALPREVALHPDELQARLRMVDGLVKIHRELTRKK